jgi:hypothetical protein
MSWYLYRLLPHRADFARTMTVPERAAMVAHVAYWSELQKTGAALLFSPVDDPVRSWGMAVVQGDEDAVRQLRDGDPAVVAGVAEADFLLLPLADPTH